MTFTNDKKTNTDGLIRIGGLWKNSTKDGKTYLGGTFGGARLMVFPNGFKEKDDDPDYVICIAQSQKKEKSQAKKSDAFDL